MINTGISAEKPFGLRMPPHIKAWIRDRAHRNVRSVNTEILLLMHSEMEREALASENSDGANRLVAESPVAEEHPAV